MRLVDAVGCERFAELTFDKASSIIADKYGDRCWVESVTVREHGAIAQNVREKLRYNSDSSKESIAALRIPKIR